MDKLLECALEFIRYRCEEDSNHKVLRYEHLERVKLDLMNYISESELVSN